MPSIIGDGLITEINIQNFGITSKDDDIFIIRKSTSDGSFKPILQVLIHNLLVVH